jgi:DNA-binding Xre family transcriptional regulator
VIAMAISYKKLWKLQIDKDMKKKDLQRVAGISSASVTKLGKNENVNTEILQKICTALNCDISDIMEMLPDEKITDNKLDFVIELYGLTMQRSKNQKKIMVELEVIMTTEEILRANLTDETIQRCCGRVKAHPLFGMRWFGQVSNACL